MVLSLAEERNFTDCDYTDGDNCLRTFYVATDGSFTPVMIDEGRSKQPIFSLTHVHVPAWQHYYRQAVHWHVHSSVQCDPTSHEN